MLTRDLYFIPAKIDLNDIREERNGVLFLLEEEDRNTLISFLSDPDLPDGYYSKHKQLKELLAKAGKTLKLNAYDVVKLDGEYYVVYKGLQENKHIGSGGEAVVKATQNLRDGSWDAALKIISERHTPEIGEDPIVANEDLLKAREAAVKKEYESSKAMGMAIGLLPRRIGVSRKGIQDSIMMRFARGEDLWYLTRRYTDAANKVGLPTTEWINIAIQICELVEEFHANNKVHCDLKLENFQYDPVTKKVKLLDFSNSGELDDKGEYQPDFVMSTGGYRAKETFESDVFTKKSDIFAVGVTIAEMLNLVDEEKHDLGSQIDPYELKNEYQVLNKPHPFISERNKPILKVLYEICQDLMAEVAERPADLKDVIEDLYYLKTQFTENLSVGIINAEEYRQADKFEKQEMLDYFKNFAEVVIMDTNPKASVKDHVKIQRELMKFNVIVRDKVFIGEVEQAKNAVQAYYLPTSENLIREYHTFSDMTVFDKAKALTKWNPDNIPAKEKNDLVYRAFNILHEFSTQEFKSVTLADLRSMLLTIKLYAASLETVEYNAEIAALIGHVLEKINQLELDSGVTARRCPDLDYINEKSDAYQILSEMYLQVQDKGKSKKYFLYARDLATKPYEQVDLMDVWQDRVSIVQERIPEVTTLEAIKTILSVLNDMSPYRQRKVLGIKAGHTVDDLNDTLQKFETWLSELAGAKQTLLKDSNLSNKKYLDLCNSTMEFLTSEIVAMQTQIDNVDVNENQDPIHLAALADLDNLVNELQNEKNTALATKKNLTENYNQLREEAQKQFVEASTNSSDSKATLTIYHEIQKKLDSIPINKRIADDVILLAEVATSAVKIAENNQDEFALATAVLLIDKAKYFLALKTYQGSSKLVFDCIDRIAKAYEELCAFYMKRSREADVKHYAIAALDFLTDSAINLPANLQEQVTGLKVQFEMMQTLDLEAVKPLDTKYQEEIFLSAPSLLEKIKTFIQKSDLTKKDYENILRQLNDISETNRSIEYYTILLKVINGYGKFLQDNTEIKSAQKILNWGLHKAGQILPNTDAIAVASLYIQRDQNEVTKYLVQRAITFYYLANLAMLKDDYNSAIIQLDQATILLTNISPDSCSNEDAAKVQKFIQGIKSKELQCINAKSEKAINRGKEMAKETIAQNEEAVTLPAEDTVAPQITVISVTGAMETAFVQSTEPELCRQMEPPQVLEPKNDAVIFPDLIPTPPPASTHSRIHYGPDRLQALIEERDILQQAADNVAKENLEQKQKFMAHRHKTLREEAQNSKHATILASENRSVAGPTSLPITQSEPSVTRVTIPVTTEQMTKEQINEKRYSELQSLKNDFKRMRNQYVKYKDDGGLKGFRYRVYNDILSKIVRILDLSEQNQTGQVQEMQAALAKQIRTLFKEENNFIKQHRNFNTVKLFLNRITESKTTLEDLLLKLQKTLEHGEKDRSHRPAPKKQ